VRRRAALAGALVALALAACGGGGDDDKGSTTGPRDPKAPTIRLGTKNFTEQFILGELYAGALRARGYTVQLKRDIGSSEIIHSALSIGSIDMYPEYLGVLLSEIARQEDRPKTAEETYRAAKRFEERRGFTLLADTPFSDSNALAVKPSFARRHGIRTIADLARVPGGVTIGAPPEFRTRFEGLRGLRQVYGLREVQAIPVQIDRRYAQLDAGRFDAALVFTTDGQLDAGDYVVLRDPKGLFSLQHVAPVMSRKLRDSAPHAAQVIDAVSARLTTTAMREMNAAVDLRGEEPAAVAARFLREQGLGR